LFYDPKFVFSRVVLYSTVLSLTGSEFSFSLARPRNEREHGVCLTRRFVDQNKKQFF
jgi:hypothetical protein